LSAGNADEKNTIPRRKKKMNNTIKRTIDGKEITIEITTEELTRLYNNFVYKNVKEWVEDELIERGAELEDSEIDAIAKRATDRIVGKCESDDTNHRMWCNIIDFEIDEAL
jgi:isopentenyldiphosphate isomerase